MFALDFLPAVMGGIFVATLVGAGKEIVWDWWMDRGNPDVDDFLYTILGAVVSIAVIALLILIPERPP
jgi:drug/metabolite transporter superfamily protein YnfA